MARFKRGNHRTPGGYRSILVASQSIAWAVGQLAKLRFAGRARLAPGLFEGEPEHCLILTATHQSLLDHWLITGALRYRQFRALTPVRILATQTFRGREGDVVMMFPEGGLRQERDFSIGHLAEEGCI